LRFISDTKQAVLPDGSKMIGPRGQSFRFFLMIR